MVYEYIPHGSDAWYRTYPITTDYCKPHYHYDFELLYVLTGSLLVTTRKRPVEIHPYEGVIIDSNSVHSLLKRSVGSALLAINFSPDICRKYFPELKNIRFGDVLITSGICPATMRAVDNFFINTLRLNSSKPAGYQLKSVSDLTALIFAMLQELPYTNDEGAVDASEEIEQENSRFERILKYIAENYRRKLTLSEIASLENLNVYYLSHYFKKVVGVSFQEYLSKVRLSNAVQTILKNPGLPVSEVALEAGFSDLRYMKKAFQDMYDCSITEFRENEFRKSSSYKIGNFAVVKKRFDGLEDYYLELLYRSAPSGDNIGTQQL